MIRALAEALRREGFEVVTPLEAGTHGADDVTHLQWASEHGFILLTFDKQTMVPLADEWVSQGLEHGGVIVCEQIAEGCGERDCEAVEECCSSPHQ